MAKLIVKPQAYYELLVHPHFADLGTDFTGYANGMLSEFTVMDNVSLSRGTPIIDIFGKQNFLKRKERSCKTDWSTVMRGSVRKIHVDELYGAVEDCQEEFYDGCLKDFRDQNPRFRDMVMSMFKKGLGVDLAVNSYFGNVERPADDNGLWSWNMYDGIFTKIAKYIADNTIPGEQVLAAIPAGDINPADAYDILMELLKKQPALMDALPDQSKGIYASKKIAQAYWRYIRSKGEGSEKAVGYYMNGIPVLDIEGVPIFIEPLWDTVLKALNAGVTAHAAVLTIRENWIFGTNKTYGGGENLNQAYRVWYSEDDDVWRQKAQMVAGTEMALPEQTVFSMTNIG